MTIAGGAAADPKATRRDTPFTTDDKLVVTDFSTGNKWVKESAISLSSVVTGPAGSNQQIQFNDGGVFGAQAGFTFSKVAGLLTVNELSLGTPPTGTILFKDSSGIMQGDSSKLKYNESKDFFVGKMAAEQFTGAPVAGDLSDSQWTLNYDTNTSELKFFGKDENSDLVQFTLNEGVAGNNTEVQYNDNGSHGADSQFTFDGSELRFPEFVATDNGDFQNGFNVTSGQAHFNDEIKVIGNNIPISFGPTGDDCFIRFDGTNLEIEPNSADATGCLEVLGPIKTTASVKRNYVTKSSDYSATNQDHVIVCTSSMNVTLPDASAVANQMVIVKNHSTSTIGIGGYVGQLIDTTATKLLDDYQSISLLSIGTGWVITSSSLDFPDCTVTKEFADDDNYDFMDDVDYEFQDSCVALPTNKDFNDVDNLEFMDGTNYTYQGL